MLSTALPTPSPRYSTLPWGARQPSWSKRSTCGPTGSTASQAEAIPREDRLRWQTTGLDNLAEGGGAKKQAVAKGVKAGLHGKNPFWAALKGAWQGGTPVVRAAIIAALASTILLLLLSPVLLVVFLLSLLIIAAVHRARAAKT